MKYIKKFEAKNTIELIGYPYGDIIIVNQEEFDELRKADFDISWDDEVDISHGQIDGQWRFMNDEEEEIEDWLYLFRKNLNPDTIKDIKKYNF